MADYPHIEHYYEELRRLIEFGGSTNEQSTRRAFESCLTAYCLGHREKLMLVPELTTVSGVKKVGLSDFCGCAVTWIVPKHKLCGPTA